MAVELLAALRFVLARSAREWRLLAISFAGLVVAVGLAASISLYSYGALGRRLDAFVADHSQSTVGLPLRRMVLYVATDLALIWPIGLVLVVGLTGTAWLVRRLRRHEAVWMGEEQ